MTTTQQPEALNWADMSSLDVALALAKRDVYVFPVDHPGLDECAGKGSNHDPPTCDQRGKHPTVAFTVAASTNLKMIVTWFAGTLRNVGIYCGKSNLIVIDEDQLDAFQRYAEEHGVTIPATSWSEPARAATTISKPSKAMSSAMRLGR